MVRVSLVDAGKSEDDVIRVIAIIEVGHGKSNVGTVTCGCCEGNVSAAPDPVIMTCLTDITSHCSGRCNVSWVDWNIELLLSGRMMDFAAEAMNKSTDL